MILTPPGLARYRSFKRNIQTQPRDPERYSRSRELLYSGLNDELENRCMLPRGRSLIENLC